MAVVALEGGDVELFGHHRRLALIRGGIPASRLEVRTLERSYHVATLDYDAEDIFRSSADFFRRHVGDRA